MSLDTVKTSANISKISVHVFSLTDYLDQLVRYLLNNRQICTVFLPLLLCVRESENDRLKKLKVSSGAVGSTTVKTPVTTTVRIKCCGSVSLLRYTSLWMWHHVCQLLSLDNLVSSTLIVCACAGAGVHVCKVFWTWFQGYSAL